MGKSSIRWGSAIVVVAFAVGFGAACGDDDVSPAVGQCNTMVTAICNRMVTCTVVASVAACHTAVDPSLPCGRAVGVSANYSTCLGAIPAIDCAAFSGSSWLPASCTGVILMNP